MNNEQSMSTAYVGNPSTLKGHSIEQIEKCLTDALRTLTGERIVVSINNLQFAAPTQVEAFAGGKSRVHFDVVVASDTKQVPVPF